LEVAIGSREILVQCKTCKYNLLSNLQFSLDVIKRLDQPHHNIGDFSKVEMFYKQL